MQNITKEPAYAISIAWNRKNFNSYLVFHEKNARHNNSIPLLKEELAVLDWATHFADI